MSASTLVRDPAAAGATGLDRPGWAAVTAGAVVATAVTVMLLILGSGIGLGTVSASSGDNPSPATFTALAAIWLIIVQWVAAFFGGYVTGRLRPALPAIGTRFHDAETLFRDTALGFVTWAITTLIIVSMVGAGAASLLGSTGKAIGGVAATAAGGGAAGAASSGASSGPGDYLVDMLFRPATPSPGGNSAATHTEAAGILATAATGPVSPADHDYLVQMVTARTGLAQDQASQRVDAVIGKEQVAVQKAKQVADAARRFAAETAVYTFFSMLVGAFIACVAAAIGGRQRDTAWKA